MEWVEFLDRWIKASQRRVGLFCLEPIPKRDQVVAVQLLFHLRHRKCADQSGLQVHLDGVVEEITVYRDQPSSGCEPSGHVILRCEVTEGVLEALVHVDHHGVSLSQSQLVQNTRTPVIKAYRLLFMEEAVNLNRDDGSCVANCAEVRGIAPRTAEIVDLVSWDRYNPRGLPFT